MNKIKSLAAFQKLQNIYNEYFGYVSQLRRTQIYSDHLEFRKFDTKEIYDPKAESISDLKIKAFWKNMDFNPNEFSPTEKAEYEKRLEMFDYSRNIPRKKLDYSKEGIYSPDFFRGLGPFDRDMITNVNPSKESIYRSVIFHNAAHIHMKRNLPMPKKIEINTNFKNRWIKDFFQPPEDSSFLLNTVEGFTYNNDDYKFWRGDKKHSYLKTLSPHNKMSLFSKIDFDYKGEYLNLKFIPDFHPEVFFFKRSSPSISTKYREFSLRPSTMMKTEKIFRRLLWNEYNTLRRDYKVEIPEFQSLLGSHEIIPEGFAKKGHYIIQVNKNLEDLKADLNKVQLEMKEAVATVANLKWMSLFNGYQKKKFTPTDVNFFNKCLKNHKSPLYIIHKETNSKTKR